MSDNVIANAGSGGATFATDECSVNSLTVHVPWMKLGYGTHDSFTPVTTSAGFPVQVVGTPAVTAVVTNAGTFAVQAAATQSGTWNIGTVTAVTGITNTVTVTGAAGTFPVTDSGGSLTIDAPVGTPVFVRLSDGSAAITTLPVSIGSTVTVTGAAGTFPVTDSGGSLTVDNAGTFATQPGPSTSGGLSIHRSIDLDEGTLEVVKASAGQVYGMWVTNTATSTRFIKFYDATSGTAGTGTPVITIGIPGNSTDDISGNFGPGGMGIAFATGICVGATTGAADADTGAPSAGDLICNIFYK
jgi:hypothetical protein